MVEAVVQAVEEEPGDTAGDGRGGIGVYQLLQGEPLTAQALLGAEVYVERQWPQTADQVHVGHSERSGVVVLLSDAQEGLKLRLHPCLLQHLADCCVTCPVRDKGEKNWGDGRVPFRC